MESAVAESKYYKCLTFLEKMLRGIAHFHRLEITRILKNDVH